MKSLIQNHKSLFNFSFLATLCLLLLNGCQSVIPIKHDLSISMRKNDLNKSSIILNSCIDNREKRGKTIGKHTMSLFRIKLNGVRAEKELPETITKDVKLQLEQAGYEIIQADSIQSEGIPKIDLSLEDFWFESFTWFWPLNLVDGDVKIRMTLRNDDKEYHKQYVMKGTSSKSSFVVFFGFGRAAKESYTKVIRQASMIFDHSNFEREVQNATSK